MLKLDANLDKKGLWFFDKSYNVNVEKIDSLLIVVKAVKTGISKTFDCIEYKQNRRVLNEILQLTGKDFGLDAEILPDDVYRCKLILNGMYESEISILKLTDIETIIKKQYEIIEPYIYKHINSNDMINELMVYKTAIMYNSIMTLKELTNDISDTQIITIFNNLKKL